MSDHRNRLQHRIWSKANLARRKSLIAQIKHPFSIKKDLDLASFRDDAEGKSHDLSPGHFLPAEVDKGFKWRKVLGILLL